MSETVFPPDADDARPKGDGIGRGRLRRSAPLAALTARTAGEAVVVGLRGKLTGADSTEFHVRTAERYAELLGRSKGALMKAGQMLSFVSLGPAVGEEFQTTYQTALTRLRNDAPPMAPELAREVLERELGKPTESIFAEFDWEPLAAASIGQVHAARLHDDREVAVKIQYPGVAAAIRSDLKNTELLTTFLGLIGSLSPRKLNLDLRGAAQEMGERITEELDYRLEAANQAEFAELYRGHPFIHIPEVLGELCTDRVLTQELVQGKSWNDALASEQELRDSWAEAIHRFLYGSYHYHCMFNADPHPGNYVFHDDGSVSFLDFGCVKRLHRDQVQSLNLVMRECLRGDVAETWRVSVEGGFFSSTDSLTPEEVFEYWWKPIEMYWGEQPFTVTPEYVAALIESRYSPTGPMANAFRQMSSPPAYTTMSRIDIGAMSLISELRGENYWKTIAAEYFENADPSPRWASSMVPTAQSVRRRAAMPDWTAWPFPTEDPYPAYHAARAQAPVLWDEQLGAHLVLSHDHAAAILRSSEWSSDPRNSPQMLASLSGSGAGPEMWSESLLMSDPPTHTRLRSSVNRFFTPRAVARIRERVAAIVDSAFAPAAEGEPIELMSELAYPIPLAVIAELFDVGLEGAELLRSETPTLARMLELDPTPAELEAIGAAAMTVMLFLVPIVARRRSDPGEDLLSALIHPPEGGVALETDEIITMCLLLLAAGHETTANLIGNGTLALFEHPQQLDWLVQRPDVPMQAVDELLRYDSPVQVASRIALSDLTLGGTRVLEGQQALIVLGAANRDPSPFSDPDRLDLTRTGPRHLAFGNGPHFCVGAGLARLEAQETFKRLVQLPLRPSAGSWLYSRDGSRTFRRLRSLHVGGSQPPQSKQTLDAVPIP